MSDLIRRSDVMESANRHRMYASANRESVNSFAGFIKEIDSIPAVDAVPWEFLERYADWFCAVVSMPEFIREAKAFYKSINEAMKGGHIDG